MPLELEPIVGEPFDVFISYAHADEAPHGDRGPAQTLAAMLEAEGYTVWWDRQLLAGKDWARELAVKVGFARKVIALCSQKWLASDWCRKEEFRAYETEGKLIPVIIESCALPDRIARLQHVPATGNLVLYKGPIISALGPPSQAPRPQTSSRLPADDIWLEGLPTGTPRLFGRDEELTTLLSAWGSGGQGQDPKAKTNAVVLHAIGGAGKSALLRRFLDALEEKGFPGAAKVYGWSAYSQGSGDNRNADADGFISRALKFFGHDLAKEPITDPVERGRTLARLVRRQRTLLVLDGLEPLQDLPHVNEGRLKDRGLQALVTSLARENPGLLVITSRQELPELAQAKRPAVINHELNSLNERAGAELLKHLGVHGRETELMAAVKEIGGHALSVSLLGTYLSAVCAGDVARRDTLRFYDLVDTEGESEYNRQAKRANRIMDAYVERFEQLTKREAKGEGDVERLVLSLVGLFDRPAEPEALAAVLAAPPIPDLTEGWHKLSDQQRKLRWEFALKRLRALKLIASEGVRPSGSDTIAPTYLSSTTSRGAMVSDPEGQTPIHILDAHPVVRQHFGRRLKEEAPDAFGEANRRLYEHYKALPQKLYGKELPDTLEEMQPLFLAIAHGCAAGLHQEVFDGVYYQRVLRGSVAFINHKLGANSADLGALAHFFDPPWARPHPSLSPPDQSIALNFAGYALRALGRLREAVEPFRESVKLSANAAQPSEHPWRGAAANASNLSELILTLGDVGPAVATAREGVAYAEKSGDVARLWRAPVYLGHALHEAGAFRDAEAAFLSSVELRKNEAGADAVVYAIASYYYASFLLDQGRLRDAERLAAMALRIAVSNDWPLYKALDTLSLARAGHQAWRAARGSSPFPRSPGEGTAARRHLDDAVEGLRKAGSESHIPSGLLARAAFRRDTGEWDNAQEDLAETHEIASRGGMRLHLTDYHLERARLLLAQIPDVTPPDEWTLALARAAAPAAATTEPPRGWLMGVLSGRSNAKPAQPAAPAKSTPPTLTDAHRALIAEADKARTEANALIQATGYHRRDAELDALRKTLDALAA